LNLSMLNPRMLLLLICSISTTIWIIYKPYFSFQKYISLNSIMNYSLFYILIFVCAFMAEKSNSVKNSKQAMEQFKLKYAGSQWIVKEALVMATIAAFAQLLWIANMVKKSGLGTIIDLVVVQHNFETFKLAVVNLTTISGVTTFTQLGILASGMYAIHVFGLGNKGKLWIWIYILFPGILRGMFFSERLALVEVIAPIVIVALLFEKTKLTLSRCLLVVVSFVLFFSISEGLRSYSINSKIGVTQDGMYTYGINRFFDYISSSVNHSMAMVDLSGQTIGFPSLMFNGFMSFVSVLDPAHSASSFLGSGLADQAYLNVKQSVYSAPDYTNMGFLGHLFQDSGYMYILYALIFGVIIGRAFKGILSYQYGWMAVYPIILMSVMESYRIPYLFETRVFYPLLYICIRYIAISLYKQRYSITDTKRLDLKREPK
jgi:hypothetical protein